MEILGIGPSELAFIIIIALIVLGPRDMQKAGRMIGKWLRRIVTSDGWKLFQQTSREIQTLPNRLMREAALEEMKELQKDLQQPLEGDRRVTISGPIPGSAPIQGPPAPPAPAAENRILPAEPSAPPPAADKEPGA
jgi:sec-independent protein translocase protein TatB